MELPHKPDIWEILIGLMVTILAAGAIIVFFLSLGGIIGSIIP